MPELIDRQAAIATLNEMQDKAATGIEDVTLYRAIKVLRDMPTIEAEPVRHSGGQVEIGGWKAACQACGIETALENRDTAIEKWNRSADNNHAHWIDLGGIFACSNCGAEDGVETRFCSSCGFKMDGI